MRLKLIFVLLCLVVVVLAYEPNKSDKVGKPKSKKDGKDLTTKDEEIETKDLDELIPDEDEYEDEEEDKEKETSKKEAAKKKKLKKEKPAKKEDATKKEGGKSGKKSKKAEDDPMDYVSENESIPNMTSADIFEVAREHRLDKLREIINDTQPDGLEKLRQITESVKNDMEEDDSFDDTNEYQACNYETAKDDELCHCDQDEIDCSEIVMDADDPNLRTIDLKIMKQGFKPMIANFSTNRISRLIRNKVLPGFEKFVQVLDISHNEIRFADSDVFKPFVILSKLDLHHNNLANFKKPLFDVLGKTLHRLDLGYNNIKTLPDNIFDGLTNLKKLILDGNPIKVWKKEIFKGLDSLQILSLDNCKIEDLPADIFEYLPKLVGLSLRGNPLIEIPSVVAHLKSLKEVDMSATNLTEIRDHAFSGDSDLEEIMLQEMKFLSVVRDCGFCGLPKLKTLWLNDNPSLMEIHPNAFGFIKSEPGHKAAAITELDLHNSNLTTISEHMIDYDKLKALRVGENPWNCNCDTMFLMDEKFDFHHDSVSPKCASPENVKDKHLETVHASDVCEDARFIGRSGRFSSVLGLGLLVAFIAVGLFYLHSSGKLGRLVRQVRKEPEVIYTNLQSNGEDFAMESDFQARPAEV